MVEMGYFSDRIMIKLLNSQFLINLNFWNNP